MKELQSKNFRKNKGKIHFAFIGICMCGCLFLLTLLSACISNDMEQLAHKVVSIKDQLQSGDLIVRAGTDEISMVARNFNRVEKIYSHCGIIQIEKDSVFVYHALGGKYNPSQKLLRQTLEDFSKEPDITQLAIFRYVLTSTEEKRLTNWILDQYTKGLPFDVFFNFYTDDKMYCSEFVFKAYDWAKCGMLLKRFSPTNPVYISIDDLYLQKDVVKISEIK